MRRNEYLAAENRILRTILPARLRLSNSERITLAEIGKGLERKALAEVACVAKPDTIRGSYRELVAQKFDGSKYRQYPGRPPVSLEVGTLAGPRELWLELRTLDPGALHGSSYGSDRGPCRKRRADPPGRAGSFRSREWEANLTLEF